MSTLNIGTTVQISGTNQSITGILSAEGIVPAGSVIFVARNSAPDGYLPCNGASLLTTTYSALFTAIGYNFGGSGNTFILPDLRGEFIRGWDNARGVDTGRTFGSAQTDDFKSHTHNINNQTDVGPQWIAFSRIDLNPSTLNDTTSYGTGGTGGNDRIFSIVNTGGTETRPRNISLLACIKY